MGWYRERGLHREVQYPGIVLVWQSIWPRRVHRRDRETSRAALTLSLLGLCTAVAAVRVTGSTVSTTPLSVQSGVPLAVTATLFPGPGELAPGPVLAPPDTMPSDTMPTGTMSASPTSGPTTPARSKPGSSKPAGTTPAGPVDRGSAAPARTAGSTRPAPGPARSTPAPAGGPAPVVPPAAPPAPVAPFCTAAYAFNSVWNGGFVVNITLTNTSSMPWNRWSGTFVLDPTAQVVNSWGGMLWVSGTSVALAPAGYNAVVQPGGSVTIGFQAQTPAMVTRLSGFTVQGRACQGAG